MALHHKSMIAPLTNLCQCQPAERNVNWRNDSKLGMWWATGGIVAACGCAGTVVLCVPELWQVGPQ